MCMASQVQPSLPSFLRYSLFRLLPRFHAVGLALSTFWSNCFLRISLWLGLFSDVFSQNLRHSVSGGYGRMGNFGGAGCDEGAGGRWVGHARDGWMGWTDGRMGIFPSFFSFSPLIPLPWMLLTLLILFISLFLFTNARPKLREPHKRAL
ncbi:hypothetical protein IWX49DRAFT_55311 [Phyllosticta citricarpa]|uniref:Transmembrane protein n=1 Tax=Phyllosticta citricarpa TaxID=55181 RepID=A0ABR1MPF0_9PEZI